MKFVIKRSTNYQYYFDIKSNNGQILCHSETYTTKQSAKDAIEIIKREASTATTEDLT
jgi:uncharacterized protein YegP (UPF0339 family)